MILLESLPGKRRWYLPGLIFILLSLDQFKRVFPKTSKIPHLQNFPLFPRILCCQHNWSRLYFLIKRLISQRKLLKVYMGLQIKFLPLSYKNHLSQDLAVSYSNKNWAISMMEGWNLKHEFWKLIDAVVNNQKLQINLSKVMRKFLSFLKKLCIFES